MLLFSLFFEGSNKFRANLKRQTSLRNILYYHSLRMNHCMILFISLIAWIEWIMQNWWNSILHSIFVFFFLKLIIEYVLRAKKRISLHQAKGMLRNYRHSKLLLFMHLFIAENACRKLTLTIRLSHNLLNECFSPKTFQNSTKIYPFDLWFVHC